MAKTVKEALMSMVEAFINNKTEESEIALHEAFVLKTQEILEAKECKDDDKEDKDADKEDKKEEDKDEDKDDDKEDSEDDESEDDEDDKEEMEESFKAKKPAKKMLPKHKSGFKGMKKVKAKV